MVYIHAVHNYWKWADDSGAMLIGEGMDTEIELDEGKQKKPHIYRFKWNEAKTKVLQCMAHC